MALQAIATCKKMRGYKKTALTKSINAAAGMLQEGRLTETLFGRIEQDVVKFSLEIEKMDNEIDRKFASAAEGEVSESDIDAEMEARVQYHANVLATLDSIKLGVTPVQAPDSVCAPTPVSFVKPPRLSVPEFCDNDANLYAFKQFKDKFCTIIGCLTQYSDAQKLIHLKSLLGGRALQLVEHLSIVDTNYSLAMSLLTEEFLNIPELVNESLHRLTTWSPKYDPDFKSVLTYVGDVRALLHDLQTFDLDFLDPSSAGCKLASHIVFGHLPSVIRQKLIDRTGDIYPSVIDIFKHTKDIVLTIVSTKVNSGSFSNPTKSRQVVESGMKAGPSAAAASGNSDFARGSGAAGKSDDSMAGSVKPPLLCRLCSVRGHGAYQCRKFGSREARLQRAAVLGLCQLCLSSNHGTSGCLGNQGKLPFKCFSCNKMGVHNAAVCPSKSDSASKSSMRVICHSVGDAESPLLHPVICLKFSRGGKHVTIPCLLDTGASSSTLDMDSLAPLNLDLGRELTKSFDIAYGSVDRAVHKVSVNIHLTPSSYLPMPFFIEKDFEIKMKVRGWEAAMRNLKCNNIPVSKSYPTIVNDTVQLKGLIGIDILDKLFIFDKVPCLNASAVRLNLGNIPFGPIEGLLSADDVEALYIVNNSVVSSEEESVSFQDSYVSLEDQVNPVDSAAVSRHTETSRGEAAGGVCAFVGPQNMVNFVLNPRPSYFDPLGHMSPDSSVEGGLENLFSLESIGIRDESNCKYDSMMIRRFEEGIQFRDDAYHVELPWHAKVKDVPSNFDVAAAVAIRVHNKLSEKGLANAYEDVFKQQLADGIIERCPLGEQSKDEHVWIPHRPVIKTDELVTTKIRPVFNCSLKSGSAPSLNESAYPGVDLLNDLVRLLLNFRLYNFTLLADIKQAFLQIKMAKVEDRNRFSFVLFQGGKLVAYRYSSIVFGFVASPFILNFIVRHHADQYASDLCSHVLRDNFYVDNLVLSHNSVDTLLDLYHTASARMKEGGFTLRAWASNSPELKQVISQTETCSSSPDKEKVLGYSYSTLSDRMSLSQFEVDLSAGSKRAILSQVSSVFDPLGFCLPVTVRGKLLIRDMWMRKLEWDERVSSDLANAWQLLARDLVSLNDLSWARCCMGEDSFTSLAVFCDASSSCYGFTVYGVSSQRSSFLFAKVKVPPVKSITLPTLELMSVFLGFKCLSNLVRSLALDSIVKVEVAVDAQVVLNWLLSKTAKIRNVFANNRLKDIFLMQSELEQEHGVAVSFRFVSSEDNLADMLTRGMNFEQFSDRFDLWMHGPAWLRGPDVKWPSRTLGCLSEENKAQMGVYHGPERSLEDRVLVVLTATGSCNESIFDPSKYSSFSKLIGVTARVFKAVNIMLGRERDATIQANAYWLKRAQLEGAADSVAYLSLPVTERPKVVPPLVQSLDLFLDDTGIVRSRGRIAKSLHFSEDVRSPILLPKAHHVTSLVIQHHHNKCKHMGLGTTVSSIRNAGLWIPRVRQAVKNVLKECFICKKYNNLCFKYPAMTALPGHRVNFVRPFEHTGVDFTGHLWVQDPSAESTSKMYILIFTCLNVRAIHVELVSNMSTRQFLLAFLRFCNLYGCPLYLYSDNAPSFIAGGSLLESALTCSEFQEHLERHSIRHVRIPVYSAWVGATWERLIRVLKSCLYKTVGRSKMCYFDLLTILSDIQFAINSRPLSYRSAENELEIITPAHFVRPFVNQALVLSQDDPASVWVEDDDRDQLVKSLERREQCFHSFRALWYDQYLLSLREQTSRLFDADWSNTIKAGDVVLVKMPNKPRPWWLLGRVLELVVGFDGKVRSVKLRRADGAVCHHSITHLYPLEVSSARSAQPCGSDLAGDVLGEGSGSGRPCGAGVQEAAVPVQERSCGDVSVDSVPSRPSRAAAKRQRALMQQWLEGDDV